MSQSKDQNVVKEPIREKKLTVRKSTLKNLKVRSGVKAGAPTTSNLMTACVCE
jgi:hypothetical protein